MRSYLWASLVGHLVLAVVWGLTSAALRPRLEPVEVLRVDLAQLPAPPVQREEPRPQPPAEQPEPVVVPPEPRPAPDRRPEPETAEEQDLPPERDRPVEPAPPDPDLPPAPEKEAAPQEDVDFLEPEEAAPPAPETSAQETPAEETPAPAEEAPEETAGPREVRVEAHEGIPDYYLALLQRKIDRRWEPSAAGERGGAGVACVVRFRISPAGQILSPEVVSSSGFGVFDREALQAVLAASPLPPPPARSRAAELPISVRFNLDR